MLEALKRYRWPLLLSILVQVALLLHVVGVWHSESLTRLEYQLYDMGSDSFRIPHYFPCRIRPVKTDRFVLVHRP